MSVVWSEGIVDLVSKMHTVGPLEAQEGLSSNDCDERNRLYAGSSYQ